VDVVIITPEPGRNKEIGQRLLALADDPRQVQWTTWPAAGFAVSSELFARFDADGDEAEGAQAQAEAPKRRRRRSKDTDNNTSEEE
jgi:hypothetical protein